MANMIEYGSSPLVSGIPPQSLAPLFDKELLQRFLMKDRYANAYLLGMLDQAYDPFCKWFGRLDHAGEITDLVLKYQGLSIPIAFLVGAPSEDARPFFQAALAHLPKRFEFHVISEQMSVFRETYNVNACQKMHRMGLENIHYTSHDFPDVAVERLGHRDTAAIMRLYEHYPDHFFEPYQLESGLYFGVRDPELGLISIAGVHNISFDHDVAVIGNLVTHPSARGKGLASACTGRLLDELFEKVSFVALNVQSHNEPAIRMYTNFGFGPNNIFYEGRCES